MNEAVTAVLPLYNKAATVERAVRSVLGQTCPPARVIVVDDGSTDDGPARVEALDDPRVLLLRQENAGPGAARNRGVAAAATPLVGFLDADDEWYPGFLEHMTALAARCPSAVLYLAAYEETRGDGGAPFRHPYRAVPDQPGGGYVADFFEAMRGFPPVSASSAVARRAAVEAVGGFPARERLAEDWDLWARLGLYGRVAFDPAVLAVYHRDAPDRLMDGQRFDGRETPLVRTLAGALERGAGAGLTTPRALRRLLARHMLEIAKDCLARGETAAARRWIGRAAGLRVLALRCLRWWWRARFVRASRDPFRLA